MNSICKLGDEWDEKITACQSMQFLNSFDRCKMFIDIAYMLSYYSVLYRDTFLLWHDDTRKPYAFAKLFLRILSGPNCVVLSQAFFDFFCY